MGPKYDVSDLETVGKALGLEKLQSKYGIKRDRYVKIKRENYSFFYASGSILESWAKRYGSKTKLKDAISKWEAELKAERDARKAKIAKRRAKKAMEAVNE